MLLKVKFVGTFAKYQPDSAEKGVAQVEAADGFSVSQLAQLMKLPSDKPYMVSVNDQLVPSAQRDTRYLSDSDEIKFIPPLKGG